MAYCVCFRGQTDVQYSMLFCKEEAAGSKAAMGHAANCLVLMVKKKEQSFYNGPFRYLSGSRCRYELGPNELVLLSRLRIIGKFLHPHLHFIKSVKVF